MIIILYVKIECKHIKISYYSLKMDAYKKQLETLTSKQQVFCLNPRYADFLEICNYTKLCNEQGPSFEIWRWCCLSKYGTAWGLLPIDEAAHKKRLHQLKTRLVMNPRRSILDQMWFCFFATGEFKYLRRAYEVGADSKLGNDAVTIYYDVRNTYESYFNKAEENWDQNETVYSANKLGNPLTFQKNVFVRLDELIQERLKALDQDPSLTEAGRTHLMKYQQDADEFVKKLKANQPIKETETDVVTPKSNQKDRLKKANSIFDELSSKLVIKKK